MLQTGLTRRDRTRGMARASAVFRVGSAPAPRMSLTASSCVDVTGGFRQGTKRGASWTAQACQRPAGCAPGRPWPPSEEQSSARWCGPVHQLRPEAEGSARCPARRVRRRDAELGPRPARRRQKSIRFQIFGICACNGSNFMPLPCHAMATASIAHEARALGAVGDFLGDVSWGMGGSGKGSPSGGYLQGLREERRWAAGGIQDLLQKRDGARIDGREDVVDLCPSKLVELPLVRPHGGRRALQGASARYSRHSKVWRRRLALAKLAGAVGHFLQHPSGERVRIWGARRQLGSCQLGTSPERAQV